MLTMFSTLASADATTPPLTIKSIGTGWTPNALFIETNEGTKVEGCSSATIRIDLNNAMIDHILSIALSAYHTSSKVEFRVKGCNGNLMNATSIAIIK
ncbi:hypothetical protein [Aliiglaciecola sp. M165]|uniref:hypothetical protein n=1 Tax=Aliiglaciecola sp. M165 TaxID=2593649 RepID=UPI00118132CB|nr:hypothetical protein [Aliiglaciecola sp. M165]TRY33414.1 hypothetical protein FM019_05415 [Aliiglaciecola sp. M165]